MEATGVGREPEFGADAACHLIRGADGEKELIVRWWWVERFCTGECSGDGSNAGMQGGRGMSVVEV